MDQVLRLWHVHYLDGVDDAGRLVGLGEIVSDSWTLNISQIEVEEVVRRIIDLVLDDPLQRQSVDTHSHQIKRLTGLVRDLEVKNRELREQVSDNTDEADDASDDDSENTPATVDDLLDETAKC